LPLLSTLAGPGIGVGLAGTAVAGPLWATCPKSLSVVALRCAQPVKMRTAAKAVAAAVFLISVLTLLSPSILLAGAMPARILVERKRLA
jgi:hypothetical protein